MKRYIASLLTCFMCVSVFSTNTLYAHDILTIEENLESMSEKSEGFDVFENKKVLQQQNSEDNSSEELFQEQSKEDNTEEQYIEQITEQTTEENLHLTPPVALNSNFDGFINVAKNGIATAEGTEPGFEASKAIDGDITSENSRWSANELVNKPSWILIDLKEIKEIKGFRIYWEHFNIDKYRLETSNDAQNWDVVKTITEKPTINPEDFVLENLITARYVRLYIENITSISSDADEKLNKTEQYPSTSIYELEVYATDTQEEDKFDNLALTNGIASANGSEVAHFGADKAIDGKKRNELGDDGKASRWASSYGIGEKWLQVDFDKMCTVNEIKLSWEKRNATEYEILYSETGYSDDWKVAATRGIPDLIDETIILETPIKAAAIRLHIKDFIAEDRDGIVDTWATISVWEFEIYGTPTSEELPSPPSDSNIALNKKATASDVEANTSFTPDKAVDGNKTSRWASATQKGTQRWWKVDFGHKRDIKKIVMSWERRNTLDYEIQISNNDNEWTTIHHKQGIPDSKRQSILLDEVHSARYLKINVNDFQDEDPDGGDTWHSVSIYEVEVYQTDVFSIDDAVAQIKAPVIGENDTKLPMPVFSGDTQGKYDVEFIGADYEQVIDKDGTIYRPIVDTEVSVNYKVYEKENPDNFSVTPNITILVPGQFKNKGDNEKPFVSPELREWYGYSGDFTINNSSKIIINSTYDDELHPMAEEFAKDYTDITGRNISISTGSKPSNGDFYFTLGKDGAGLKKEGYLLNINDGITVEAEDQTGAYWATRTILQILKQNGKTIPKGITRDYPKFEIRGFMLDVGRKPFDNKFIEDIVKNMSWYKLNDLHLHLSDNYIFLEDYTNSGKDPMTAYSGFRLESDLVGENGVKLTSEDTYYTKEWFGNFIDNSKIRGINIVPEFDTPAHSLAFTKIRPDLRYGTNGRENDHLDIKNHMDEVVELIQGVFNEYMEGPNPIFRQDTIVHVGTDEFEGDGRAFMDYTNIMTKFVKDTGRTVRIWGSLSSAGVNNIVSPENVQMNLWYPGYANPKVMYDEGFKLINTLDSNLYMVPDASYYHDYLDSQGLYDNWNVNNLGGFIVPIGSSQMLGAAFAVWNDMVDIRSNGISQGDIYDRIKDAMPTMSEKLWGNANDKNYVQLKDLAQKLGEAPNSNPRYEIKSKNKVAVKLPFDDSKDYSGNKYDGNLNNAELNQNGKIGGGLYLKGDKSYFELPIENMGISAYDDRSSSIEFWVKKEAGGNSGEQILFESNKGAIKAVQKDTGKVGFSREEYDYSFDYSLPENEWVKLRFTTSLTREGLHAVHKTELYVNDKLVDSLSKQDGNLNSSLVIPLSKIGSEKNSFKGEIDEIIVYRDLEVPTALSMLKQTIETAQKIDKTMYNEESLNNLQIILQSAIEMNNNVNATESELKSSMLSLADAIDNLKLLVPGAKSELETIILHAQTLDQSKYESTSWEAMQKTLTEAIKVRDKTDAEQSEIDTAKNNLEKAINNLILIDIKADLKEQIQKAQELDKTKYELTSWEAMQKTLTEAIKIRDKADAEQSEIDTAANNLKQAINNLKVYKPNNNNSSSSGSSNSGKSSLVASVSVFETEKNTNKLINENSSVIKPIAIVKGNEASVLLSSDDTEKAISQALKNKSGNIIIQPDVKEDVAKIIVNIPSQSIIDIKDKVKTNIIVKTPVASIEILNKSLKKLYSNNDENLSISSESKDNGEIEIQIKLGSTFINNVEDGIKVLVPVNNSSYNLVAEIVNSNGIKMLVNKSVLINNEVYIPLNGTATIKVIDNSKNFNDIKNHWSKNSIDFVTSHEIFKGTSENEFSPEKNMTRGMLVTVLHRLENTPKSTLKQSFNDVKDTAYYSDAVIWASENNLVNGIGNNFEPDENITREQLSVVMYNYAKSIGLDTSNKADISGFSDSSDVSVWANEAIEYAVGSGLISSKNGKKLEPKSTVTRAEIAFVINQFVKNIALN